MKTGGYNPPGGLDKSLFSTVLVVFATFTFIHIHFIVSEKVCNITKLHKTLQTVLFRDYSKTTKVSPNKP